MGQGCPPLKPHWQQAAPPPEAWWALDIQEGWTAARLLGDAIRGAQMDVGRQRRTCPLVQGGSLPGIEGGIGCRASGNWQCPLIRLCLHPGPAGRADISTLQMAGPCLFISSPLEASGPLIDFVIVTCYLPLCGKMNKMRETEARAEPPRGTCTGRPEQCPPCTFVTFVVSAGHARRRIRFPPAVHSPRCPVSP